MKQSLNLKLTQQLTLTPQLQQAIRLLQLSNIELNEEIEIALADNPLLEREESLIEGEAIIHSDYTADSLSFNEPPLAPNHEEGFSEALGEVDSPTEHTADSAVSDEFDTLWGDESGYQAGAATDEYEQAQNELILSLQAHLEAQIGLLTLNTRDHALLRVLIDELDTDGYLRTPFDDLLAMLPAELEVSVEELQIALCHLQQLDPAGIGARDVAECLGLQLATLLPHTPYVDLAQNIVKNHLAIFAAKDYNKIRKQLNCDDEALRAVHGLIKNLNPRPGAAYGMSETRYVVPDVVVSKVKGVWLASLNKSAMPKLRINQLYSNLMQQHDGAGAALGTQLQEARWLIKNIQQRFETILRVSQEIVDRQSRFLEYGEVAMRPLILRDIAEQLSLHESTISRVTTHKYMLTPRGVFELKYFFGSHVETDTGGECSAIAIKALIKEYIQSENTKKPLSDSQLVELLSKQGVLIARRTVAKYREALHIPAVAQRKEL